MQIQRKYNPYTILSILFVLCIFVNICLYFFLGGYNGYDLEGHWSISAYTLKGYNPYELIGVDKGPCENMYIPNNFSTVPWGTLLGSAFYGGFLPLEYAVVFNALMHFVFIVLAAAVVAKSCREVFGEKRLVFALLLLLSHFSFMYSAYYGNAGGIICSMLIMSIFLAQKHPYLAAILLSLAMAKPQIAAIVCIIFLLERQWKTLILAAFIDVASWIAVSVMTKTSILELLTGTFSSGTASEVQYLGLLSVFKHFGMSSGIILALNVLIGLLYTVVLWRYLKKNADENANPYVVYAPACVASVFWIYKNGTDYFVLTFAVIFLSVLFLKKQMEFRDRVITFVCICYMQMSRCLVYLVITLFEDKQLLEDMAKSIDGLLIALFGIVLCRLWVKYNRKTIKE